jgi:RNA polymerase sigma factor (sigma-70 family)
VVAEGSPGDGLIAELYVQAERTAARLVGSDRAEDIASETLIRALSRWSRISGYPHAWVTRVATNLAIDVLRKPRPLLDQFKAGVQSSFETDAVRRIVIVESLRRLPRRQRQVVVLHYLAGFTHAEVSQTLGLSPPTVKTHLSRAMTTLRRIENSDTEERNAPADSA